MSDPFRKRRLRSIGLGLLACVGCGKAGVSTNATTSSPSVTKVTDWDLSAEGVVAQQMQSLAAWRDDPLAVERAFSFASPGNRAVTGPVDRFAGLVESEPYLPLTANQGYVVGRAVESKDAATVLVTLIDRSGTLLAYRFYLSRQKGEPHRRWMTDAVYRFTPDDASADGPVSPTI